MKKPTWRPWRIGFPHQTWRCVFGAMSFDCVSDRSRLVCSGPCWPNSQPASQKTIQLSMIVVITSWAPTVARRKPAIPASPAPASEPRRIARTMCGKPDMPVSDDATQTPTIDPAAYWPWPPMLKRPARKANATARPVRISGVVSSRVD